MLARWERSTGRPIYLISDEPYREVRYTEEPFVSPAALSEHGLLTYSFSKSHSIPGERIGYLAINPACDRAEELEAAFALANRVLGFTNAPSIWQRVLSVCLDASIDIEPLRLRRDRLLAVLEESGYSVVKPDGGFYLFPKAPGGDDQAFVRRAMEALLLVVPGGAFGRPGHFRIAFCGDDRSTELAIARLPMLRQTP